MFLSERNEIKANYITQSITREGCAVFETNKNELPRRK